jgi:hypothetical protein
LDAVETGAPRLSSGAMASDRCEPAAPPSGRAKGEEMGAAAGAGRGELGSGSWRGVPK